MKVLFGFLFLILYTSFYGQVYDSVLTSGNWYKFKVSETGVHKITPDFLRQLGLNNVDPNEIKIYGFGGRSLDLILSEQTKYDVPQVPIYVSGGEDGFFSGDDYLLFYAEAATDNYVQENDSFVNPYSTDVYYYITTSGSDLPLRISDFQQSTDTPSVIFNTYNETQFHEEDLYNIGFQGRKWFGDKLDNSNNVVEYAFSFNDLDTSAFPRDNVRDPIISVENMELNLNLAAVFSVVPSLNVNIISGGNSIYQTTLNLGSEPNLDLNAYKLISEDFSVGQALIVDNQMVVQFSFVAGADVSAEVYLDYITLNGVSHLTWSNSQMLFVHDDVPVDGSVVQYQFTNSTSLSQVWDVTDVYSISKIENDANSNFSFSFVSDESKTFVAFDESNVLTPQLSASNVVLNQNLKGNIFLDESGEFEDVDYLIITNSEFISAAADLAAFREANDGFTVKVVELNSIYNEFSSGRQDISAIRNFVKYIYDLSLIHI